MRRLDEAPTGQDAMEAVAQILWSLLMLTAVLVRSTWRFLRWLYGGPRRITPRHRAEETEHADEPGVWRAGY